MQFLLRYANPANFMVVCWRRAALALAIGAALALTTGLYLGFGVPPDYQQGRTVTIFFIHVPAATTVMGAYIALAICSVSVTGVAPSFVGHRRARRGAPGRAVHRVGPDHRRTVGAADAGVYWVWDGRLTSFPAAAVFIWAIWLCGTLSR